jgi:hypothetical protein
MELLLIVVAVVALDVLALRFGADSRNLDPRRREPPITGVSHP